MRARSTNFHSSSIATEADVRAAYRLLLGREPDEAGFAQHVRWAAAHATPPVVLAEQFMASEEYRQRVQDSRQLVNAEIDGCIVVVRRGDHLIGATVITGHRYESHVWPMFESTLQVGSYVLDVGANVGLYTMRAARHVGTSGRVIAVEPLPQNHQALYAGILRNGFENIDVVPVAASDRRGIIAIDCAPDSSNGILGVNDPASNTQTYVPMCRLDDELPDLPRLDVVKIDIEGHEPVAWSGMRSLVEKFRPHVFSEFSPIAIRNVGQNPIEYLEMLLALSGRVLILHRDAEPVEMSDVSTVMEQWERANERAGLNGALHLDLYIRAERRS